VIRDPEDPRSARTRARIRAAVLDAARAQDDLGTLTVAELCRRAEVHRVTFYGHFRILDDAIAEALTTLVDDLGAIGEDAIAAADSPAALSAVYRSALDLQVQELDRHREVYSRLFRADAAHPFTVALTDSLRARAQLAIDAFGEAGISVPGAGEGIAAGYLGAGVAAAFSAFVASEDTDLADVSGRIFAQLPSWWPPASDPS
jgi:AcrR family transcriptional regulator